MELLSHRLFSKTDAASDIFVYTTQAFYSLIAAALSASSSPQQPAVQQQLSGSGSATHRALSAPLSQLLPLLDPAHTASAAADLPSRLIRVVSPVHVPASLSSLLSFFRPTHPVISVECGPTTTGLCYAQRGSGWLDELLLSVYKGEGEELQREEVQRMCVLPSAAAADGFVLNDDFMSREFERRSLSKSGRWRFEWLSSSNK